MFFIAYTFKGQVHVFAGQVKIVSHSSCRTSAILKHFCSLGQLFVGPCEVIKLIPCSTQLSMKFILLINVKMPTIVGILTFISMINTTSERLKAINFFIYRCLSFYEQLKFRAQLS